MATATRAGSRARRSGGAGSGATGRAAAKAVGGAGGADTKSGRTGSKKGAKQRELLFEPDTEGPRVRIGVLWFFVTMAALTGGRLWISIVCGFVSALAGYQITRSWMQVNTRKPKSRSAKASAIRKSSLPLAAALAGALPLLAGYGTGAVGLGFLLTPVIVVGFHIAKGANFVSAVPALTGSLLPSVAAVSIVLSVRLDLWAGLFLIFAVSLYDAGAFLLGAESDSRWEGPVSGIIGALAVTFTMGVFHPNPFTPASVAVSGVVIALSCPVGQMLATRFLPQPGLRVSAMRRLDSYLIAGPAFYVCASVIAR